MNISEQIDRIKGNIALSYAKAAQKGAVLPAVQNSDNLPGAIEMIPSVQLPEDVRTITLEKNPAIGGTVEGGGCASEGMNVTVKSAVNTNYTFSGWQENGQTVSTDKEYPFTVTGNRTLIAVFAKKPSLEWLSATMPSSSWQSVTYGNGKFVAIKTGYSRAAYSEDGINWKSATLPSSAQWCSVAYGNDEFVAVAFRSDKSAYSTDGINWTESTLPDSADWQSVTFGDGKFAAVATTGDKAAYSV